MRQWGDPISLVRGEIGKRVRAAGGLRMRDHRCGELTPIEGVAIRRGDVLQRVGHRAAGETLAGARRAAVGQEVLGKPRCAAAPVPRGPFLRDDRRHC